MVEKQGIFVCFVGCLDLKEWLTLEEWFANGLIYWSGWPWRKEDHDIIVTTFLLSSMSYEGSLPFFSTLTSALTWWCPFLRLCNEGVALSFLRGVLLHLNLEKRDIRWGHRIFIWQGMLLRPHYLPSRKSGSRGVIVISISACYKR